MSNVLSDVRPNSQFASFKPKTQEQQRALDLMKKVGDSLVENKVRILKEKVPFADAKMLILWGKPGRGKTHLVEGLINHIKNRAPELLSRLYLSRDDFTLTNLAYLDDYDKAPIVILDDVFSDKNSVEQLHPNTDIAVLMKFVKKIYEERRFVIITSNFSFKSGILKRIESCDPTGRIVSRMAELLSHFGEIELLGEDYRMEKIKEDKEFSI